MHEERKRGKARETVACCMKHGQRDADFIRQTESVIDELNRIRHKETKQILIFFFPQNPPIDRPKKNPFPNMMIASWGKKKSNKNTTKYSK